MGTNYYFKPPECKACGRGSDAGALHIGKSSAGWCFSLHVIPEEELHSLNDWKVRWESSPGWKIKDEYGRPVSIAKMWDMITERSSPRSLSDYDFDYASNHAAPGPNGLIRFIIDGHRCIGHQGTLMSGLSVETFRLQSWHFKNGITKTLPKSVTLVRDSRSSGVVVPRHRGAHAWGARQDQPAFGGSVKRVVIMAQGRQERLSRLKHPKHLLEVDGEAILARTIRLVRELRPEICPMVIGPQLFRSALTVEPYHLVTLRDPGFCILDGLAQVLPHYLEETVVLLGDVVYSRAFLADLISFGGVSLRFYGTAKVTPSEGELFAFQYSKRPLILDLAIDQAPCRRTSVTVGQPGHLRHLLKKVAPTYMIVDDWTNDIDTLEDVRDELPKLSAAVKQEKEDLR